MITMKTKHSTACEFIGCTPAQVVLYERTHQRRVRRTKFTDHPVCQSIACRRSRPLQNACVQIAVHGSLLNAMHERAVASTKHLELSVSTNGHKRASNGCSILQNGISSMARSTVQAPATASGYVQLRYRPASSRSEATATNIPQDRRPHKVLCFDQMSSDMSSRRIDWDRMPCVSWHGGCLAALSRRGASAPWPAPSGGDHPPANLCVSTRWRRAGAWHCELLTTCVHSRGPGNEGEPLSPCACRHAVTWPSELARWDSRAGVKCYCGCCCACAVRRPRAAY
jgi:hypothetical protein